MLAGMSVYFLPNDCRLPTCRTNKTSIQSLLMLIEWRSEGTSAKEVAKQNSTSLQFGDISFQREVKKITRSVNSSEVLDRNLNGAIICENEGVPAVCGIRAIWVTPSNRGKHIASQLLDAVREGFL
ncbi:hypothetical protein CMV_006992 [Castanea mollissima]|uniref:N-acetyltransferase ESCO acetyl-transferase domain-containing protein n=1 Tax=Castanea mollissima TaxID=60419 RepID=A0A8J4W369_9ROSI|nr:hypothetical protein CMV_006992 [Castanea mollissima]